MSKSVRLALLLAGAAIAQEDYTQWGFHKELFLNTSPSGADVAGDLQNFPVLVRFGAGDAALFSQASAGGADLRFTKSDGVTRLPHQIERWDSAAGAAEVWVLVDQILGNNDSQAVRVHWGKADAADSSSGSAVFGAHNGFAGVWHLGGSDYLNDATANANHGVEHPESGLQTADTLGLIGRARYFSNPSADAGAAGAQCIQVADHPSLNPALITLSVWIRPDTWGPFADVTNNWGNRRILQKRDVYSLKETDDAMAEFSQGMIRLGMSEGGSPGPTVLYPVEAAFKDTLVWHHLAATYDGSKLVAFFNGAPVDSLEAADALPTAVATALRLGGHANASDQGNTVRDFFFGIMDEPRVAAGARSYDWIRLEYENQKENQTLVSAMPPSAIRRARSARGPRFSFVSGPAGAVFGIPASDMPARLIVLDMRGREVWRRELEPARATRAVAFAAESARAGIYFARLETLGADGKAARAESRKIVLTR